MADYSVTCSKLGACADKEQDIIKLIAEYQRAVSDIGYHVRIKGTSEQILRENILAIVDNIEDCKARTTVLSDTLRDIAEYYLNTEKELIATKVSHEDAQDKNTTSAVNEDTNEPESDDLQEAIDFLNNLSMSTSIDGVVLTIINELIQLYQMNPDAGLPGSHAAGIAGLITGVAADVMSAMSTGATRNALMADLIVDLALWGVGEGTGYIGGAVGTAVGGSVGTIVGNFVGGLVGNGVSIAMNVDWDGDGQTGKDGLSDWIDDQLDKIMRDAAIA